MGRPRTRSDEEIRAAAARALGRVGLGALTLAAVAEEAGLSPAALVQRFGSKRELLLAVARGSGDSARATFAAARAEHAAPLDALSAALGRTAFAGRQELANNLSFLQLDLVDPDFNALAREHAAAMRAEIEALLREAVACGTLAGGDLAALARAVHVAYNGSLITWAIDGDGALADQLREDVERVLAPHRTR